MAQVIKDESMNYYKSLVLNTIFGAVLLPSSLTWANEETRCHDTLE